MYRCRYLSNTWSIYLTELTAGKDDWSNLIIVTFAVKMILRDICIIIINLMIFTGVPRARFSPEVHDETQPCKRTRVSSTRPVCCIDSYRWTRYQMERWRPFKPRRAGEQVFWRPPLNRPQTLRCDDVTNIKPNRPRLQLLSSCQQFCRCLFWNEVKMLLGAAEEFSTAAPRARPSRGLVWLCQPTWVCHWNAEGITSLFDFQPCALWHQP